MNISQTCSRIIKAGFYLLFTLVPLLLTPINYELFEYNKMMAVYVLTTVVITAWVTKMVHEKELNIARTPLDMPILFFVFSQLISSLFSIDPHVSWFGYYSRFNGGMFSIISYVLLYYAFVSNKQDIKKIILTALGTVIVVALYGVAERLGVDKHLWVQDVQNRVFSTLGQPNWLAAYLVALLPLSLALGMQKNNYFWFTASMLFFAVLLFTRSRSGLLGLAVADIIFLAFSYKKTHRTPLITCHILFALIIFFNGSHIAQVDKYFSLPGLLASKGEAFKGSPTSSGPALESGGTESGVIRKYVWQGAINAWKSSTKAILIGTGTETFAFAFYQYRPAGHNLTSEWDFLYNKAHNEYLNYLATTGIFGLGSYLFFIGTFIWWFLLNKKEEPLIVALFAGWASILVTNFFGFSVVIVQVFFFLFPAIIIASSGNDKKTIRRLKLPPLARWIVVPIGIFIFAKICSFWYADTRYAHGYRANRSEQYSIARISLSQAILLNPSEPIYRDEIATTLASLSVDAVEKKNATEAATLAQESLSQNDRAIRISPANVNFWKTRTKIYYSLSVLDSALNDAAIEALSRAVQLSPNDPKLYYNLAILNGRSGNNDRAIEYLMKAKNLKPNYRDAYNGLYIFYTEIKKPAEAQEILKTYLTTVNPQDTDFQALIK